MCLQSWAGGGHRLPSPQHHSILDYWTGLCVCPWEGGAWAGAPARLWQAEWGDAHLADYRELAALHACPVHLGLGGQTAQGPALFCHCGSYGGGVRRSPEATSRWADETVSSVGEESCTCSQADTEHITS